MPVGFAPASRRLSGIDKVADYVRNIVLWIERELADSAVVADLPDACYGDYAEPPQLAFLARNGAVLVSAESDVAVYFPYYSSCSICNKRTII